MYYICHVTSQDYPIDILYKPIGGSSSQYVNNDNDKFGNHKYSDS